MYWCICGNNRMGTIGSCRINTSLGKQMNSYWVMVKWKDEPGAGFSRAYLNADNPFQAISMARSMYGRLLISESANPA